MEILPYILQRLSNDRNQRPQAASSLLASPFMLFPDIRV